MVRWSRRRFFAATAALGASAGCLGDGGSPETAPDDPNGTGGADRDERGGGTPNEASGHVYRGAALAGLAGDYVFGDLAARGRLFAATPADGTPWRLRPVPIAAGGDGIQRLLSIGRGPADELYVLGMGSQPGAGGVYRVSPTT